MTVTASEVDDRPGPLRLTIATLATAYWYFAVATLVFAVVVPLAAGWRTSTVTSNSMAPAISAGDVVSFADYDGSPLDVGTIVQFNDPAREGSTITHRIAELNTDGTYQTKGDANTGPDSTDIDAEAIVGVARIITPLAGLPYLWFTTGRYPWLATWILLTAGAAMFMGLPASATFATTNGGSNPETPPPTRRMLRELARRRRRVIVARAFALGAATLILGASILSS